MANGLFNLKQVVQAIQQGGWPAQKTPIVEYLVVAGGGGGGAYTGAGAGGLLQGVLPTSNGQALLVTVGGGGATNTVGSNSVFSSISTTGGGTRSNPDGGSGSGGWNGPYSNSIGLAGQGIFGQGNAGGYGRDTGASYYGGGGGGAGTPGFPANQSVCGAGGNGVASVISGTVTAYGGGGGGGQAYGSGPGAGGVGGGGAGGDAAYPTPANGYAGTSNTGGGGGGSSYNGVGANGGAGGSGIVIVSYPDVYAAAASTTGSPTISTSGSGSVYFNGSSALTYPNNSAFSFATGDLTVEFWIYATSFPTYAWLFDFYNSAYTGLPFNINVNTTPAIRFEVNGTTQITGSTTLSTNTWYHIALARSGTSTKLFINGTQEGGTYTDTNNYVLPSGSQPVVGSRGNYGYPLYGYMSNVRVVKGTALYTSNFTPSKIPLTAVSGTSLLLNTVSGSYAADGSGNGFAPTATGSPAWNSVSPFTGTGYKNRVYTWTSSGSITF